MHAPFSELALLLLIAAAVGALAVRLRQPLLIAYILVGILVGPTGFGLVQAHDQIDLLAQMGVAVLLFLVGLKLDLQHVRHIGPVALAHKMLRIIFAMLKSNIPCRDRVVDYEALSVQRNAPRWIKMLVKHGFMPASA